MLYYLNMNTHNTQPESISERKRQRTASRYGMVVVVLLFIALLAGGTASPAAGQPLSAGDIAWAGLAIAGFALLLWSQFVSYRQSDERQQFIQLKAAAVAFMGVLLGIVVVQLFHALGIVTMHIATQVILIGGILLWNTLLKFFERRTLA